MTVAEFNNLKNGDQVKRPTFRVMDGNVVRNEEIVCTVSMDRKGRATGMHAGLGIYAAVNTKDWVLV